jgi:hypothetical protein
MDIKNDLSEQVRVLEKHYLPAERIFIRISFLSALVDEIDYLKSKIEEMKINYE